MPFSVCALNKVYTLFLHFALYSLQCPTVYKIDISDLLHFSTLFFFFARSLVRKNKNRWNKKSKKRRKNYYKRTVKSWRIKSFIIGSCMVNENGKHKKNGMHNTVHTKDGDDDDNDNDGKRLTWQKWERWSDDSIVFKRTSSSSSYDLLNLEQK